MELNLPREFENKMKTLLESEWESFENSYKNNRFQALRGNSLKKELLEINYKGIRDVFQIDSQKMVPWAKDAFYYEEEQRPGKHPFHEMGLYYIQEPSAMSAAAVLDPKPGMKVLDLCAAPGGKSTQLAAMLDGKGLLVANEINSARCKILSSNIERMGITNAIVTNEDSEKLANHFGCFFHAVLVDAPCSGEGMFRKNPEAVEEWSMDNVALCAKRQKEILDNAARMLYPGGKMVYSTCTFSPEENENTIADFLSRHEEFELLPITQPEFSDARAEWVKDQEISEAILDTISYSKRLWPHKLDGEGHYVALLQKRGNLPELLVSEEKETGTFKEENKTKKKKGKKSGDKTIDATKQFLEDFLTETFEEDIVSWIRQGKFQQFGEQIYRLPQTDVILDGIHVLRAGLHLGEMKKNRFEPSHALALAVSKEQLKGWLDLPLEDERTYGYFRGESIFIKESDAISGSGDKGWCAVCVDGMPAGWGKMSGGQVKNHYPKGLRKDLKID